MNFTTIKAARVALRSAREAGNPTQVLGFRPHQGERERRRRRAQIADGKLHAALPDAVDPVDPAPMSVIPDFIF